MMFPRTRGTALGVLLALPNKKADAAEFLDYDGDVRGREVPAQGGPR